MRGGLGRHSDLSAVKCAYLLHLALISRYPAVGTSSEGSHDRDVMCPEPCIHYGAAYR